MRFYSLFLRKILCFYLFENQTGTATSKENFSPFPRCPRGPGLGQTEAGSPEFHAALPARWLSPLFFQCVHQQEAGFKATLGPKFQQSGHMMPGYHMSVLGFHFVHELQESAHFLNHFEGTEPLDHVSKAALGSVPDQLRL